MIKKKLIPLFLVAAVVLAGCGSADKETPAEENTDTAAVSEDASTPAEEAGAEVTAPVNEVDYSTGLDDSGYHENVTAGDYVELFDYESLDIPSDIHIIPDSTVQTEVEGILAYFTTTEPVTDRDVVDGDTVNIDYVGSIDGVEFEGGNTGGNGTDVTIGVTSYIDDFLEQLIGHKPGDTIDVNVTFPEDYGVDNLNGKDALFVTTINHIVKEVVPELTDDFVAENLSTYYDWATVQDMTEGIHNELQKASILQYIQTEVISATEVSEIPESVMDYQKAVMANYYKGAANEQGLTLDDFLAANTEFQDIDALYEAYAGQLTEAAEFTLVIQAIAEAAGIQVDEATVADYFLEYNGSEDYSQYEEIYGIKYLKFTILQDKVMEYLTDNAELM